MTDGISQNGMCSFQSSRLGRPRAGARRQAFTLIELLVVISIIALLVSILLPALGSARDQASKVSCASNQRQVALSATAYTADNNEWYPVFNTHSWLPGASCYLWEVSATSRRSFESYLGTGELLYCPSVTSWRTWSTYRDIWPGTGDLFVGYYIIFGDHPDVDSPEVRFSNYSGDLNQDGSAPVKTTRGVNDASDRIILSDIYDEGPLWPTYGLDDPHNHERGSNQAYVDGHVAWKNVEEMQRRFYINIAQDWW
jgi:prepilin-type N-terminal cleavage/methylation domain-containing protein/prepilin-type processing-associated H-X9-DG protein